ncbi:hypothetical protein LCGC14_1163510 [marine sediment metagenome]|uniref:Uncharacterized protein n=1 Tax=marine sediment metagenome TaxID=412755 RepID=A0A0F9LRU9_9ZZZZ
MIITETFTAKDSICDWCNTPIPDGKCIGLNGYSLVYGNSRRCFKISGPFVPCPDCAHTLDLPTVNIELILTLHKTVAVQFKLSPDEVSIEIDGQ